MKSVSHPYLLWKQYNRMGQSHTWCDQCILEALSSHLMWVFKIFEIGSSFESLILSWISLSLSSVLWCVCNSELPTPWCDGTEVKSVSNQCQLNLETHLVWIYLIDGGRWFILGGSLKQLGFDVSSMTGFNFLLHKSSVSLNYGTTGSLRLLFSEFSNRTWR